MQWLNPNAERVERGLRQEMGEGARGSRQELAQSMATFQDAVTRQGAEAVRTQNAQVDALAMQLTQLRGTLAAQLLETRGTLGDTLVAQLQALGLTMTQQAQEATRTQNAQIDAFAQQLAQLRGGLSETLTQQLQHLSEANARRLAEVRGTLEQQLSALQTSNSAKLDQMRQTVDEKLHATLEQRLGESFKQVAERLEQVHKGLGEMQTLAQGVGDLKHLLANVKTRGTFGEVQLGQLLEQVFAPEQYAEQVGTVPGSKERVDFAIRLPGRRDDGAPLWLEGAYAAAAGTYYCAGTAPQTTRDPEELSAQEAMEIAARRALVTGNVVLKDGLGLLAANFESRVVENGAWGRLFALAYEHAEQPAFGLGANTALVVTERGAEVIGEEAVVALDLRTAARDLGENGAYVVANGLLDVFVAGETAAPCADAGDVLPQAKLQRVISSEDRAVLWR